MFLAVLVFTITAGFLFFGNAEKASASYCVCYNAIGASKTLDGNNYTNDSCAKSCTDLKFTSGITKETPPNPATANIETPGAAAVRGGVLKEIVGNYVSDGIKVVLQWVLSFVGMLLSAAATIFGWIINVNNFKQVVDGPVIYQIWQRVRDLLNIAFILVLLYSAFCTILQIEKYSYKKLLLNLVIMALLVNFSFPITRFIIDASNVLMYTIANTLLGADAGNALGNITDNTGIKTILDPGPDATATYLIAAIVFTFILAITLLAVGVLLIIRMIALALLIIFSPLAFVTTILPDASGYSSKWWDNLFKYSFFGPIMLFVIFIATQLIGAMAINKAGFERMANQNTLDPSMIGAIAYFSMPIVLLWMGMGIAQSMSIAGAGAVMGGAQKFIGKVGKFVGKAPFKGAWWGMKKTGVPEGAKQRWAQFKRTGVLGSEETEKRGAWFSEKFGVKGAVNEQRRKAIQAKREEIKKQGGMGESELEDMLSKGGVSAQAAALELAEKHGFKDYDKYKKSRNILEQTTDKSLTGAFDDFTKKKRIDFVISYKMEHPDKDKTAGDMIKDILDKTSSADYKNIDFKALFGQSGEVAKNATQEYFKDLAPGKKADIAKNLRKESMAEVKNMFGAIKRTTDEIKKEEDEKHNKFAENFTKNM